MAVDDKIQALVRYSDLPERLKSVPASARYRGLYFRNTITVLRNAGKLAEYQGFYPESYSAVRWYPSSDFLERLAVAGAILRGPENVYEGMREIGYSNALAFAQSLLGRTMLRLLSGDPVKLLKQACAARRQSCNYGRWEVAFPEPRTAVMEMYEEYIWLESNLRGAAEGTLASIGLNAKVECEIDSMFQGRHIIRWE